jgi:BirA family biotin operon repressor/biotin-[acetyl-CoA-carboxylase] ligase
MIRFGEPRFHAQSVESTQTLAVAAAREGAEPGTAFTASNQTAGRGRRGKVWSAPPGANVNLSLVGSPIPGDELWQLAPLAGVCVVDALTSCFPRLGARLRFPNDVVAGGRKLAGLLVEAVASGGVVIPVTGVGVNVRSAARPPEIEGIACSVEDCVPPGVVGDASVEIVTSALLEAFSRRWDQWRSLGAATVVEAWNAAADPAASRGFHLGGNRMVARVGKLDDSGRVELFPETGGCLRVSVADVVLGEL